MEIKINKEIRKYFEQFLLGMSLRNMIFLVAAAITALIVGFNCRGKVGSETLSWIITFVAVPFLLVGFVKIKGMSFEKFVLVYVRTKLMFPKKLTLRNDNIHQIIMEEAINENNKKR